jgi:predicted ABC-type ATPase
VPTPDKPEAVVLAGPNGAGKTTVSPKFLGPDIEFVNADIIGAALRSANPNVKGADFTAGRIVSARLTALASQRQSFCFETNLASSGLLGRIQRLETAGYHTNLIFVALPDVETALARVAARVIAGGHHIPDETVRRRFKSGLHYFFTTYRFRVVEWSLWDNANDKPVLVADSENQIDTIYDPRRWDHLANLGT